MIPARIYDSNNKNIGADGHFQTSRGKKKLTKTRMRNVSPRIFRFCFANLPAVFFCFFFCFV
jgi:hypothetical protein